MIEMPEAATLAKQMNTTLVGKTVARFARGSLTHKFLWLNRPDEDFQAILAGKNITAANSYGRSLYIYLGKENMLWFGETGGRILYHQPDQELPKKFHLLWEFTDSSHLTFAMQMWGFVRLLDGSEFDVFPKDEVGLPPLSPDFTFDRFNEILETYPDKTKKGIKGFLVTSVHINGLGNAYLQDILFHARLHPARKIPAIQADERRNLFNAIQQVVSQAITLGGREDERDLYDQPGRYRRLMDSQTAGTPCPACGATIQKIQYLGGACYFCPNCQV